MTITNVSFTGHRAIIFYVLAFQYLYSSIDILLDINNMVFMNNFMFSYDVCLCEFVFFVKTILLVMYHDLVVY